MKKKSTPGTPARYVPQWLWCILFLPFYCVSLQVHAQDMQRISGVVKDDKGNPMTGVSVNVKGTQIGTTTGDNGEYVLSAPSGSGTLTFSFVGYTSQDIKIGNRSTVNISLKESVGNDLNEVVVLGYGGTAKKSDLTGSIGTVSAKQINEKQPVTLFDALQGQIPGVLITNDNGDPSGLGTIQIRGASTINAEGNSPLYVIDGVMSDNGNYVNPMDIESIEVLKDASSSAIYGARGANGVILITTKKGRPGKPLINLNYYHLFGRLAHKIRTVSAAELRYYRLMRGDGNNGGRVDSLNPYLNQDNDYQDLLFRTAHKQVASLTLSGGQNGLTYYAGLNYTDDRSIVINSWIKRVQSRINVDYKMNDRFRITNNLSFSYQTGNDIPVGTTVKQVFERNPWTSIYRPDGSLAGYVESKRNPVAYAYYSVNDNHNFVIQDNTKLELGLTKDLRLTGIFNAQLETDKNITFNPSKLTSGGTGDATGSNSHLQTIDWEAQTYLNYNKRIGNHVFGAMAGFSADRTRTDNYNIAMSDFLDETIYTSNAAQTINLKNTYTSATAFSDASLFGRVNYSYKSRYLLEGTYRRDGSSRFGEGNKWGDFFSGSAAWRFSDERFMNWASNVLVDGKLRYSIGQTGNDRIGNYASYTTLNFGGEYYNGSSVAAPSVIMGNRLIKWETTTQQDAGVDLTFLKGRLTLTADYYKKRTDNLLYNQNPALESGYTKVTVNLGAIENSGWEFGASGTPITTRDFTWTVNANVTFQQAKIKELASHTPFVSGDKWLIREGGNIGDFYVYKNLGVYAYDQSNAYTPDGQKLTPVFKDNNFEGYTLSGQNYTGEVKKKSSNGVVLKGGDTEWLDLNNDGVIDESDRVIAGNGIPDHFFGLFNTFRYKNFTLSVMLNGNLGYQVYNAVKNGQNTNSSTYSPPSWDAILYSWQNQGDVSKFPYFPKKDNYGNIRNGQNSLYIEDGSFIRLSSAKLTYTLDQKLVQKARLKGVSAFIYGNNLVTWTNYSWYDPEFSSSGLQVGSDNGKYPKRRELGVGINVNL